MPAATVSPSVAFFMHDFSGGGVEAMRMNLAAALVALGYEVSIIVVNSSGPVKTRVPTSVKVIDLQSTSFLQTVVRLRRYVLNHHPDILISSLDHNNIAALCTRIQARPKTQIVICQHNALSEEVSLGWRYRLVPLCYWALQSYASAVVAVSDGVANDLIETAHLRRDRIRVIFNPVIDGRFLAQVAAPPPHPWLSQTDVPVFVFVGRLTLQKDPVALVLAFSQYLKTKPAKLILIGEGELREDINRLIQNEGLAAHVFLAGYVEEPACWISRATALVLTSRYEGFGNVLVEALACGTPVIATDCRHGPREILADGKYGTLVKVGDTCGLAQAMLSNPRRRYSPEFLRSRGELFTAIQAAKAHDVLFSQILRPSSQKVFSLDFARQTTAEVAEIVGSTHPSRALTIVTPNIDHIRLLRLKEFRTACLNAEMICADGWPVALFVKIRTGLPLRRVTGCDVLHGFLAGGFATQRRVAAVVESAKTAEALGRWLAEHSFDGKWTVHVAPNGLNTNTDAQDHLVQQLAAEQPEVLLLTLGAPVSEIFAFRHSAKLPPCWILCVGQALRVEIGIATRAPSTWQRLGLEWAWRVMNEPRRLSVRYLQDIAWFPCAMMLDIFRSPTR